MQENEVLPHFQYSFAQCLYNLSSNVSYGEDSLVQVRGIPPVVQAPGCKLQTLKRTRSGVNNVIFHAPQYSHRLCNIYCLCKMMES